MTIDMYTSKGYYNKIGDFEPGVKGPRALAKDETSNVERDGYRTLKQQIMELEDAGRMHLDMLKARYPAGSPDG